MNASRFAVLVFPQQALPQGANQYHKVLFVNSLHDIDALG